MQEVTKADRRSIGEMNDPERCDHQRIYNDRGGWWYCADCPAYAETKDAFDNRSSTVTPRF